MTTMKDIANNFVSYDITTSIHEDCNLIDFRYLSTKISNFNPYCLYIFKSSNLPDEIICDSKINFLIIKDKPLPNFLFSKNSSYKYNYIILNNNNLPIYKLIYLIQDIFNINTSLLSFKEDIINAIGDFKSINEIIKMSYNYLKNPIMILNSMYQTCGYYLGENKINDDCWEYQLKHNVPHPTYSLLYNQDKYNRKIGENNREVIVTFFPEIMKYREITVPIIHHNFTIGRISMLEYHNKVTDEDLEILQTLSKLIYPLILLDKRFLVQNNCKFDKIMTYLIETTNPNKALVENALSNLNIKNDTNKYLIVIKDKDNLNSITKLNYIKRYITVLFSKHIVFSFKNNLIVIFDNGNSYKKFYKSKEFDEFLDSIENYTLKVGISKLFDDLLNVRLAYEQCEKALLYGEKLEKKHTPIYYFDDYVVFNLISSCLKNENINNIVDIKLKSLISSNKEDLYYTLQTYIQCECDTKQTANKLDIHYNTLKYRLSKIENTYNMDLNDENYLINLKLSFAALNSIKLGGEL